MPVLWAVASRMVPVNDPHHANASLSPVRSGIVDHREFSAGRCGHQASSQRVSTLGTRTTFPMPVICTVASRMVPVSDPHHARVSLSPVGNGLVDHREFSAGRCGHQASSQRVSTLGTRTTSPMPVICTVASRMVPVSDPHHARVSLSPVRNGLVDHREFSAGRCGHQASSQRVSTLDTRTTSPRPVLCTVASRMVPVSDPHHARVSLSPVGNGLAGRCGHQASGQRVSTLGTRTTSPMPVLCTVASRMVPVSDPHHARVSLSPVRNGLAGRCGHQASGQRVSTLGTRTTSPMPVLWAVASRMVPVNDPHHANASLSPVDTHQPERLHTCHTCLYDRLTTGISRDTYQPLLDIKYDISLSTSGDV